MLPGPDNFGPFGVALQWRSILAGRLYRNVSIEYQRQLIQHDQINAPPMTVGDSHYCRVPSNPLLPADVAALAVALGLLPVLELDAGIQAKAQWHILLAHKPLNVNAAYLLTIPKK